MSEKKLKSGSRYFLLLFLSLTALWSAGCVTAGQPSPCDDGHQGRLIVDQLAVSLNTLLKNADSSGNIDSGVGATANVDFGRLSVASASDAFLGEIQDWICQKVALATAPDNPGSETFLEQQCKRSPDPFGKKSGEGSSFFPQYALAYLSQQVLGLASTAESNALAEDLGALATFISDAGLGEDWTQSQNIQSALDAIARIQLNGPEVYHKEAGCETTSAFAP